MANVIAGTSLGHSYLQRSTPKEVLARRSVRVAPGKRVPVQARRTVREGDKSGPNWVLDQPKRLWEIGSRYW